MIKHITIYGYCRFFFADRDDVIQPLAGIGFTHNSHNIKCRHGFIRIKQ